jgi:hypothetical protein
MQVVASGCIHLHPPGYGPGHLQAVHNNRIKILGRNKEVDLCMVVLSNSSER